MELLNFIDEMLNIHIYRMYSGFISLLYALIYFKTIYLKLFFLD